MARHNRTPAVARPTGKRRLIEWGKDLLIVLLTCSALFLTYQTPLVNHMRDMVSPTPPSAEASASSTREALIPYALRVNNSLGAYGVAYDDGAVSRVVQRFYSYLGEAFSTAGTPQELTERRWCALLETDGLYCVFQGTPPLSAFSSWFGVEETLTGQLQALLLAVERDTVTLAWRDGDCFYGTDTAITDLDGLLSALEDYTPNGASFAYAVVSADDAYEALDDYVLLTSAVPQPQVFTASAPDLVNDSEALSSLLSALGFLVGMESAYETSEGLTVTENGDRLQVTAAGGITYRAGDETRYPILASGRSVPTAAQAAQTVWELLCRIAERFDGTPTYVLSDAERLENGWALTFEARLNGIPLTTGNTGWCLRAVTEGRKLSELSMTLRTYAPTEDTTLIPSPRLAAAALRSLSHSDGTLTLAYHDSLSATLTAGWMTGEQE